MKNLSIVLLLSLAWAVVDRPAQSRPATTGTPATTATRLAAGPMHSLFLRDDGSVWATGFDGAGQLGDGDNINRNVPVQVLDNVRAIAAGAFHSLFLRDDDTLWTAGNNAQGQLGTGTRQHLNRPTQVLDRVARMAGGGYHTLAIRDDGGVVVTGSNGSGQIGLGQGVSDVDVFQAMVW